MNLSDGLKAKGLVRVNGTLMTLQEAGRATSRPKAAATTSPKAVPATAGKVDAKAERRAGQMAERKRWTTVLAHDASKGREGLAAHLLSQPQGFAASQIIEALSQAGEGQGNSQGAAQWDDVRADVLVRTGRA